MIRTVVSISQVYSAGHLVPTTFIGLANPLTPPKMEMYDQKNKMSF